MKQVLIIAFLIAVLVGMVLLPVPSFLRAIVGLAVGYGLAKLI